MQHYHILCCQMLFECGEAAHELVALKHKLLDEWMEEHGGDAQPPINMVDKINRLCAEASGYFQK